jgi:hypothetical protein
MKNERVVVMWCVQCNRDNPDRVNRYINMSAWCWLVVRQRVLNNGRQHELQGSRIP